MNLLLVREPEISKEREVRLTGRQMDHVVNVLRAKEGDDLRVGLINGPLGSGRLVRRDDRSVTLEITLGEVPPRPRVTMILAMVRPQIMKRTLQHLATLGVRRIVLVGARRVETSYFGQRLFDGDGYVEHLLGLEQAVDTWLPDLTIYRRFKPFIEDRLPQLIRDVPKSCRYIAHPTATESSPNRVGDRPVALAVGPEGGWSNFEVDKFVDLGFSPLSLGQRTLKVETAVPYLFGTLGLCSSIGKEEFNGKVSPSIDKM